MIEKDTVSHQATFKEGIFVILDKWKSIRLKYLSLKRG